jgi:RHS repeat-associated protein
LASQSVKNLSANGTAGQTLTTTYTYTKRTNGMVSQMVVDGPLAGTGDALTYVYDTSGNLTSVKNSLNHTVAYSLYNARGQVGRIVDANTGKTEFTYDDRARLTRLRTFPGGLAKDTNYSYLSSGLLASVVAPDGSRQDYQYDAVRRLTSTRQPEGADLTAVQALAYNLASDVVAQTILRETTTADDPLPPPCPGCQPLGRPGPPGGGGEFTASAITTSTHFRAFTDYDEQSRVRARRGNGGQNVRFAYDGEGRVTTITDSLGRVTTLTYDGLGRVLQSRDPKTGITLFTYDAGDRLKTVTDPRGKVTTYTYDGLGLLRRVVSPDTGTTNFTYNTVGQRTAMTRADGRVTSYAYDTLGRMRTVTAGGQTQTFTYDTCTGGKGRLCRVDDASGSLSYTYTPEGWLASSFQTYTAGGETHFTYTYDAIGRVLIARNVVTNTETQYTYNTYGQLSAVKVKLATGAIANVATNLSYEPMGPLKGWTTGNGLSRTRAFDLDRRLTSLGVIGAGTVQSLAYTYNANDLITKITNGVNASLTQTYGYDELSRLTGVTATAENQSFGYDANGNRTTQAVAGIGRTYSTATANNRLTGISGGLSRTYGFDANGNRTSESGDNGTHDYVYDGFNRLVQHTKNGIVTNYQINALGQRAHKRTSASEQTWFGYEANGRLRIENQFLPTESNYFEYVYLAGEPVALIRNTTELYHIHADHLGRPEAVTDAAKAVRWRASNFAFDRTVSLDTLPGDLNLGFPGQYRDRETGLWYNYFRTYDPVAGRYLESDPIGLAAGVNTYAYVNANPVNFFDLFGLIKDSVSASIESAIARGDVRQLANLIESGGLNPAQQRLAVEGLRSAQIMSRTTNSTQRLAEALGRSNKEIKRAIEQCKQEGLPRGGPTRNPDVRVDPRTGEVFPQLPNGRVGDSIGNIFDFLSGGP